VIAYRKKKLHIEQVSLERIAESTGTPVYVYSKKQLLSGYRAYRRAFRGIPHLICYALKANSNLALLKLLAREGSGADIVSGGELFRALKAGISPKKIVFAGVGKTEEEIRTALKKDILSIHVESEQELDLVNEIAGALRRKAPVSFRVNPNVDPKTHPYISTGLKKHKFGIPIEQSVDLYSKAAAMANVRIEGVHIHLGSQISGVGPFEDALQKVIALIDRLEKDGITIRHLDIGGGLSIDYENANATANPENLASVIRSFWNRRGLHLILEPGRSIIAPAGVLLTKVLFTKENYGKHFVVVDAAMNDFLRPSLYGAHHEILPVTQSDRPTLSVDVVGPVCETGDFLAKDRSLPKSAPGELLILLHAGAYGFSMSSNYNSRKRPPEVLVDGSRFYTIRRRETDLDLLRNEL
jgi:diaminopimelate decarboxylase